MKHKVSNLGEIGLITDIESESIADNAWSDMNNIRCFRNEIRSFPGSSEVVDLTTTGQYIISLPTPSSYYLVYPLDTNGDGTANALYSYSGSATDRSNTTDYASGYSANGRWNGCTLHGLVAMTNYVDAPQFWDGVAADFDTMIYSGSNDWDNFDGASGEYRAKVIRSHQNRLFAIGISEDGVELPHTVHISGPAESGSMPTSWDYSSTSARSVRTPLPDSPGICVDGLSLGESFMIYKEDMVYRADFIGGVYQYDFQPLFKDRGLYAVDCVVDIGGAHCCLGDGRLYVHDGHTPKDILEGRVSDDLFMSINEAYYQNTFLAHNRSKSEVWICYPTTTSNCDRALIWNYKYNTFYKRELPNIRHATIGVDDFTADATSWADYAGTSWDEMAGRSWDERLYSPIGVTLFGIGGKIYEFDDTNQEDGSTLSCYAQHNNFNLGDGDDWHLLTGIYIKAEGSPFSVQVGSQAHVDSPITWETSQTFTPGTDYKLDFLSNGPYHAVRFSSLADVSWSISGYTLHFQKSGGR